MQQRAPSRLREEPSSGQQNVGAKRIFLRDVEQRLRAAAFNEGLLLPSLAEEEGSAEKVTQPLYKRAADSRLRLLLLVVLAAAAAEGEEGNRKGEDGDSSPPVRCRQRMMEKGREGERGRKREGESEIERGRKRGGRRRRREGTKGEAGGVGGTHSQRLCAEGSSCGDSLRKKRRRKSWRTETQPQREKDAEKDDEEEQGRGELSKGQPNEGGNEGGEDAVSFAEARRRCRVVVKGGFFRPPRRRADCCSPDRVGGEGARRRRQRTLAEKGDKERRRRLRRGEKTVMGEETRGAEGRARESRAPADSPLGGEEEGVCGRSVAAKRAGCALFDSKGDGAYPMCAKRWRVAPPQNGFPSRGIPARTLLTKHGKEPTHTRTHTQLYTRTHARTHTVTYTHTHTHTHLHEH